MSRILLADDSPHAQRMGERILRDEGYEVLTLADGEAVLARLRDFDPDLLIMKADLPSRTGYELCDVVKKNEFHKHARVVLTSGALDHLNEELAKHAGCDGTLKKPFEASVMIEVVRPLLDSAERERVDNPRLTAGTAIAAPDPEAIRAAVAVALDEAYPKLVDDLTKRILLLLGKHAG
jgi:CheY-like chemotaxis protein